VQTMNNDRVIFQVIKESPILTIQEQQKTARSYALYFFQTH
jgi:hypothetical protein